MSAERSCEFSNKVTYVSELHAHAAATFHGQQHYQCPECGLWHLTTNSKKRARRNGPQAKRQARRPGSKQTPAYREFKRVHSAR